MHKFKFRDHDVEEKPGRGNRNLENNVSRTKECPGENVTSHVTEQLRLKTLKKETRVPTAGKEH